MMPKTSVNGSPGQAEQMLALGSASRVAEFIHAL